MIELLQFRHSPYNEKVRWALDLKRVPHRRRSLLPGPHMAKVKKLTRQTATPVLINDGEVITGSACILDWLEARYPEPRLIPAAPDLCAAAMATPPFPPSQPRPTTSSVAPVNLRSRTASRVSTTTSSWVIALFTEANSPLIPVIVLAYR